MDAAYAVPSADRYSATSVVDSATLGRVGERAVGGAQAVLQPIQDVDFGAAQKALHECRLGELAGPPAGGFDAPTCDPRTERAAGGAVREQAQHEVAHRTVGVVRPGPCWSAPGSGRR